MIAIRVRSLLLVGLLVAVVLVSGTQPAFAQQTPTPQPLDLQPWNGSSRFTFVVTGMDRRPDQRGLAYRTDAMMLISLDPATRSIGVMSIPRDLFVAVPGYAELQRINSLLVLGELTQEGYGPTLLLETLQYNFGIRLQGYLILDFDAFTAFIDAIGGIEIETTYVIDDPEYPDMVYGFDPFYLPAGRHRLDGATALKFVRTRHGDNDFLRMQRQLQVLLAVRERISTQADNLSQLALNLAALYGDLLDDVYTDLSLEELAGLGLYALALPLENLHIGAVNEEYVEFYYIRGSSVLIPNRATLPELMVELFGPDYSQ